ncbi:MAG: methionine ABC transporter ATP-binding protein, partial [Burkholderia ambifaria]
MTQLFDTLGFIDASAVRARAAARDAHGAHREAMRADVAAVSLAHVGKVFATPHGHAAALRDV